MEMFKKFKGAIDKAQNIVITTHLFPDADGIGAEISLCLALNKFGKNAICANQEPLLERYKYLDPQDLVVGLEELPERYQERPDLVIVVDTNTVRRTGDKMKEYAQGLGCPVLYIDHHPCSEALQDDHCIDTTAAATGQLVGHLIQDLGIPFDKEIALPLYTAILIDTSSFRYPTVTASTHRLIADLMDTGIEPPTAYNGIYGTKRIDHMHMLGNVLSTANSSGEVAWITLTDENMSKFDVDIEDTHAFINHLLILENTKVACMFRDDGDQIKVSLRSSGEVDVGLIACKIGGGGHSHSAATLIDRKEGETTQEIINATVEKIKKALKEL